MTGGRRTGIQRHQAPVSEQMRQACLRARQFWHQHHPEVAIRLHIEDVPQFVPGLGRSGETYRVGAIQLVDTEDYLTVFLDVVTARILVEQPLLEVPGGIQADGNIVSEPSS